MPVQSHNITVDTILNYKPIGYQDKKKIIKKSISIVSLFSGCGGLDLSFARNGFDIKWANDIDKQACDTYRFNIGNHIVHGDITKIDYSQIPNAKLILGGFPCQDFSMIWERQGINAERGNLYKYFVGLVSKKNPSMFIAENVKGLLTANKGKAIKQIIKDFSIAGQYGYNIKPYLINFADYGVPQLRERILLIGLRKDIKKPFYIPSPTHEPKNYIG